MPLLRMMNAEPGTRVSTMAGKLVMASAYHLSLDEERKNPRIDPSV
jgi:hypothetical protein